MQILVYEFQNDEETIDALTELTLRRKAQKMAVYSIMIKNGILAVISFIAAIVSRYETEYMVIFLLLTAFCLTYCFTTKARRKWIIKKNILKYNKDYLNISGTWIFSEEGVHTESDAVSGDVKWSAMREYGFFGDYFFIWQEINGIILMKRRLLTDEALKTIISYLTNNKIPEAKV